MNNEPARELHKVGTELFVDVYDFTEERPPHLAQGFYYSIPHDPETGELDRDNDVQLEGPFPTSGEALRAGLAFTHSALIEEAA